METPIETVATIAAIPADQQPKVKRAKTSTAKKARPAKTAPKKGKKATPKTDEEKRLAKNAALREWRQKNKERFAAYMKAWREARQGKEKAAKQRAKKAAAAPKKVGAG